MNLEHRTRNSVYQRDDHVGAAARVLALLEQAEGGNGGAIFVQGPPKAGKSELLREVLASTDALILRVDGFEVERCMAAAGLSRLDGYVRHPATGILGDLDARGPLATGLSLLGRMRELAADRLVALVGDDAHWLDGFSLEVLGIVGRRLARERIALVLAGERSTDLDRSLVGIDRVEMRASSDDLTQFEPEMHAVAEVGLLGGFNVQVGGAPVALGDGAAATVLKIVALRSQVPAEEVEEILWPDAEPGLGRSRMRNVIHRIRAACGPLVERDGRSLRLAPGVLVDVHVFEERALKVIAALEAGEPYARAEGWKALSLYAGELLPVDRHADWTAAARERLARLYFSLFDHLELDASSRGGTAEALKVIERAIELDPYDEARYIRGAKLLAERGSTGPAASMLRSAQVSMEGLGMAPSPSLSELLQQLSG